MRRQDSLLVFWMKVAIECALLIGFAIVFGVILHAIREDGIQSVIEQILEGPNA